MDKRRWVKLFDAIIDIDAFVLFRKVQGWRECPDSKVRGFERVWTIEAFPGPHGEFAALGHDTSSAGADASLRAIHKALTAK